MTTDPVNWNAADWGDSTTHDVVHIAANGSHLDAEAGAWGGEDS